MMSTHQAGSDHKISTSKVKNRKQCGENCRNDPECTGFDFHYENLDCTLSRTPWRKLYPTGMSKTLSCEKNEGKGNIVTGL